jgi:hypothetical protein
MFSTLTKYKRGVDALLNYPKLFSFGFASHEGPTEERNVNTNFETLFVGKGWNEIFPNPLEEIKLPMNQKIVTRVVTNNPLYGSASIAVLCCAITILNENENMPESGGVLSPGAAFRHTKLIEMLQQNGFIFEIVTTDELKAKL